MCSVFFFLVVLTVVCEIPRTRICAPAADAPTGRTHGERTAGKTAAAAEAAGI